MFGNGNKWSAQRTLGRFFEQEEHDFYFQNLQLCTSLFRESHLSPSPMMLKIHDTLFCIPTDVKTKMLLVMENYYLC